MTLSHEELFQRYVYAGAIRRDPDALAELFTEDGWIEAPLLPAGHRLPRRIEGREAIRTQIGAYHREPAYKAPVDVSRSRYVLHETADPDVFIAEIDTAFEGAAESMSLVQIFRVRGGLIESLRDYFAPEP
ncbi:ketosteroid isomerase-like protein [Hamadaea flava]|uniref:Nuclear transport factor 2 family protein n=1 Tax=Hamadaea flava TaxID=1742688 RepID=A0ABV8LXN9_9ACTN|nr:nuclear transport factor 2 family protein [Hamadaea flava]MCP2329140.1 ketosteroid isomerase-like protein [Hamadaea flava]